LAGFGLSAFFFSLIGGFLFPGDTSDFLLLLACGTSGMTFLGFWFLRVIPHGNYQSVATNEEEEGKVRRGSAVPETGRSFHAQDSNTGSALPKDQADQESGVAPVTSGRTGDVGSSTDTTAASESLVPETDDSDESLSFISKTSSVAGEVYVQSVDMDRSHRVDIRGWQIVRNLEFWQLFSIMGILAGVGLMTIK
jgi:hypothetical protein